MYFRFHEPKELFEALKARNGIIIPMEIIRVRISEKSLGAPGNRYLYIFRVSTTTFLLLDDATDYSGTGGKIHEEMEKIVKIFHENFKVPVKDYEIDGYLYTIIKNAFITIGKYGEKPVY